MKYNITGNFRFANNLILKNAMKSENLFRAYYNVNADSLKGFCAELEIPWEPANEALVKTLKNGRVPIASSIPVDKDQALELTRWLDLNVVAVAESEDVIKKPRRSATTGFIDRHAESVTVEKRKTPWSFKKASTELTEFDASCLDDHRRLRERKEYYDWGKSLSKGVVVTVLKGSLVTEGVIKRSTPTAVIVETFDGKSVTVAAPTAHGQSKSRNMILPTGARLEEALGTILREYYSRARTVIDTPRVGFLSEEPVGAFDDVKSALLASLRSYRLKDMAGLRLSLMEASSALMKVSKLTESRNKFFIGESARMAQALNHMASKIQVNRVWDQPLIHQLKRKLVARSAAIMHDVIMEAGSDYMSHPKVKEARELMGYVKMSDSWWKSHESMARSLFEEAEKVSLKGLA